MGKNTPAIAMQDLLENLSRYPKYFIALIAGVFWNFLEPLMPMLKRPVTAIALVGVLVSVFLFFSLTLRAMLGLSV
jgi:hypothetical protein